MVSSQSDLPSATSRTHAPVWNDLLAIIVNVDVGVIMIGIAALLVVT